MDSHHPDSRALTRRRLLGLAGGIAAVGALAACSGEPQPGPTSSTAPTLTHWVHRFAEPQFALGVRMAARGISGALGW